MAETVWIYSILSVFVVSLVSLVGVFTLSISTKLLNKILLFLVSFAAGSLFGGAFFHLIPESFRGGCITCASSYIVLGILIFFILEKFIHWRHCHVLTCASHPHPVGMMNVIGDGLHNFLDGVVIVAAYMVSVPLGITTTIAILLHEVPQEIGDFGILLHAGYKKSKALLLNFISALAAVLGALVTLSFGSRVTGFTDVIIPITAGGFIYIAGSDLIPELQKECSLSKSFLQFISLILGIAAMIVFMFLE